MRKAKKVEPRTCDNCAFRNTEPAYPCDVEGRKAFYNGRRCSQWCPDRHPSIIRREYEPDRAEMDAVDREAFTHGEDD